MGRRQVPGAGGSGLAGVCCISGSVLLPWVPVSRLGQGTGLLCIPGLECPPFSLLVCSSPLQSQKQLEVMVSIGRGALSDLTL